MKINHFLPFQFLVALISALYLQGVQAQTCSKNVYLTFDTGNMSVAKYIANVLKEQHVVATFFLANEKTNQNDYSLDSSWKSFWIDLVKQGHAFGSHTLQHTYWQKDLDAHHILVKSQFGPDAGKFIKMSEKNYCQSIQDVDQQFFSLTGQHIQKIWRAPGGKTSPQLIKFGNLCGYQHIGWAKTGFLGDELSSEQFSNDFLLDRALHQIQDNDITMAHLGIWSRKDPWATAVLEPLIVGLKKKGFCFKRIGDPR